MCPHKYGRHTERTHYVWQGDGRATYVGDTCDSIGGSTKGMVATGRGRSNCSGTPGSVSNSQVGWGDAFIAEWSTGRERAVNHSKEGPKVGHPQPDRPLDPPEHVPCKQPDALRHSNPLITCVFPNFRQRRSELIHIANSLEK